MPGYSSVGEETNQYHISLFCGITAGGTYITPWLLSTSINIDPDFDDTFLSKFAEFYKTGKSYLTKKAKIEWIINCLISYVVSIREEIRKPNHPVVLIMDGLCSLFDDEVMEEFCKIEPFMFSVVKSVPIC